MRYTMSIDMLIDLRFVQNLSEDQSSKNPYGASFKTASSSFQLLRFTDVPLLGCAPSSCTVFISSQAASTHANCHFPQVVSVQLALLELQ